jgi:hypothetical protein
MTEPDYNQTILRYDFASAFFNRRLRKQCQTERNYSESYAMDNIPQSEVIPSSRKNHMTFHRGLNDYN